MTNKEGERNIQGWSLLLGVKVVIVVVTEGRGSVEEEINNSGFQSHFTVPVASSLI